MGEQIGHECGIGVIRLRKPLQHFAEQHGSAAWGLHKLYLLMEKQRNRGQDGAGIATCKLQTEPGVQYMDRIREAGHGSLDRLWQQVNGELEASIARLGDDEDRAAALKRSCTWIGECYLGHLRYGTRGGSHVHFCHPMVRTSNWSTRRMMMAGNFNLTNTAEIFEKLVSLGQHPVADTDTMVVMEKVAYFLDEANNAIVRKLKGRGLSGDDLTDAVIAELDLARVLRNAAKSWDGGYVMCGMIGHGAMFVLRDPAGIRPACYLANDEVVACASERAALVTCFDVDPDQVEEVPPGQVLIVTHDGELRLEQVLEPLPKASCSFERIYFSRGNDRDIYRERKALGRELVPPLIDVIGDDFEHTVFSYVPNTAEVSYYGLIEALDDYLTGWQEHRILDLAGEGRLNPESLHEVMKTRVRLDKAAHKDAKLRTFISEDSGRNNLVSHAYDISRGVLEPGLDRLVVIDDSIVRGTTLRTSLLRILLRLRPKSIVVLSSAPQIRYPDCYGIDMSELGRFIAFEACMDLLRADGRWELAEETYKACRIAVEAGRHERENFPKRLYDQYDADRISARISELVRPEGVDDGIEIRVVYQSIGGLRRAIPEHQGAWYFTGDYPTPGGYRVVNQAFLNYMEHRAGRSY